ncbi:TIGR01457 family HAD-type hydrolase [Weissella tructae]|uniref:YutF protein n=2 Tax=Weissella TaxID=46255 RepID=A0A075U718_9LACO|nr:MULTISPECIES: TIGR01457 family HAD-type hydrolase [Weissella]AIG65892.1 YutF protein [Weissella tructae]AIM63271.1 YutF protein [Weissella ceti]AIM64605.1 YutF protein [Weissella ceti]ELA07263.1 HAD family sugar phosphatase [Weissella ceti NC36]QVV91051.1 TIGR01457 family HAD-type hydrolase [Weissella tructae]
MLKYDAYFIDLDGTIYAGTESFPAAKRFMEKLKASDSSYLFVTNNSTKTPEEVAAFLTEQHGIVTTPEDIYTSAMATADYVAGQGYQRVMMIGEHGLKTALENKGLTLVTEGTADVVVVGLDRDINYDKLMHATLAIQNGAAFVATNVDTNLPNERGLLPGAGTIVAAVKTATQQEPVVVGKPEKIIMQEALKRTGLKANQVVMVGDNYQTDILAGINAEMDTLLVYTGVSTPEQVAEKPVQPTHVVNALDEWEF